MDKIQKFEQTQSMENYLEKNQVFEMFLGLLKQVLVHRPEKPLDFLIDKFSNPSGKFWVFDYLIVKRFLLIGPAGSQRKGHCTNLATQYGLSAI